MGTRRTNGEGSYGRTGDGRHTYTRQIRMPDGTLRRVKGEGKSRTIARQRCESRIGALLTPPASPTPPAPRTVEEQLTYWMDTIHQNGRATTKRTYKWVIDALIVPSLGPRNMVDLKTSHIKRWVADLEHAGRSAKTISMARTLLKAALDLAVQDEILPRNPVAGVKSPFKRRSSGKALTVAQARALLDAARGDRLELAIRLALGLGLRRGEVCGLRWEDLDLAVGTLTVSGSVTYTPETGVVYGSPKTRDSLRTIQLPAQMIEAIRAHQKQQQEERAVMGWGPTSYLFTAPSTGKLLNPNRIYATFKAIARTVGLDDFRLHDLRHSAASFLLAEGVKIKRVQAILGHGTASTTMNIYAHLLDDDDDDALDRLQRRLDGDR